MVEAPIELRYSRTIQRGRVSDHISLETFIAQEKAEDSNPDLTAQNIVACMKLSNQTITNTGDLNALKTQVDIVINEVLD